MRALLVVVLLALGCRAAPAWEPVGGYELVLAPGPWHDVEAGVLAGWLAEARARIDAIPVHAAVLEMRERIEDDLHPRRVLALTVRSHPFAARVDTLAPPSEAGQRVGYDSAKDAGRMWAETPGFLGKLVGRVSLDPHGSTAMENRRRPITDLGLDRLLEQVEDVLLPALARKRPPRVRVAERPAQEGPERLVDVVLPGEPFEAPLVHRLGFEAESGLLTYFGLAELLPDGLALVEEYWYHDLELDPELDADAFEPED